MLNTFATCANFILQGKQEMPKCIKIKKSELQCCLSEYLSKGQLLLTAVFFETGAMPVPTKS